MVMVFGAVFMSMPLAIIGNEYSIAWQEVTKELQAEKDALIVASGGTVVGKDEGKSHFMFGRQQATVVAPLATLSSISAVRGSLLKTQAASRAAMLALSAISSKIGTTRTSELADSSQVVTKVDNLKMNATVSEDAVGSEIADAGLYKDRSESDSNIRSVSPVEPRPNPEGSLVKGSALTAVEKKRAARNAAKLKKITVQASTLGAEHHDSIIEAHRHILDGSTIVETHKRISSILGDLPYDKLGARVSPMLLLQICELRSLMHSLSTSTEYPIDYLTRSIQLAQNQTGRSISGRSSVTHRTSTLGSVSSSMASLFYGNRTNNNRASVGTVDGYPPQKDRNSVTRLSSLNTGQTATEATEEEVVDNGLITSIYRFLFGKSESENETDFQVMMKKVAKDPNSLRNRMWMLLELHHSSRCFHYGFYMLFHLRWAIQGSEVRTVGDVVPDIALGAAYVYRDAVYVVHVWRNDTVL
jgi:hypothetical protein